jgi:hypothetical protein
MAYNRIGAPYDGVPGTAQWVNPFPSPARARRSVLFAANGGAEIQVALNPNASRPKWVIPAGATVELAIGGANDVYVKCAAPCEIEELG